MTNHPPGRQGGLADLASALPGTNVELEPGYVAFDLGDAFVEANVKDGAARVRIRAYLGYAERSIVEDWVQSQPLPRSGSLQVVTHDDGVVEPRLVFERPVTGNDWSTDLLRNRAPRFAA